MAYFSGNRSGIWAQFLRDLGQATEVLLFNRSARPSSHFLPTELKCGRIGAY
jgi:hypothetical protein